MRSTQAQERRHVIVSHIMHDKSSSAELIVVYICRRMSGVANAQEQRKVTPGASTYAEMKAAKSKTSRTSKRDRYMINRKETSHARVWY